MKMYKMYQILYILSHVHQESLYGDITVSGGGEIMITPISQLGKKADDYLKRKGFVLYEGTYIYRP